MAGMPPSEKTVMSFEAGLERLEAIAQPV